MELKGIKMAVIGDSITQGVGVTDMNNMYYNRIKRDCDLRTLYVDGISGTRIARQQTPSATPSFDLDFVSRIDAIDIDSDLVVVFGGTNDFGHGDAPFGELSDRTQDTFCGACHILCQKLIQRFPKSQIVYMGPLHRITENTPNQHGKILDDYVAALQTILRKYSIPFLDMMESGGIAPHMPVHKELYMPDGLHPNDAGHERIANRLKGFLQSL